MIIAPFLNKEIVSTDIDKFPRRPRQDVDVIKTSPSLLQEQNKLDRFIMYVLV
jgi:hypothetical protein